MKKNIIRLTLLPVIMILAALSMTGASYGAIARFHVTYPYGHQAADDPTLEGAYNNWVGMFVVNAGSYKRVSYPEGIGSAGANSTASEGIGYGMLLAVWFNDQTTFNNLWNYKVNNSPKSGLMAWEINSGGGIMDQNSASDADEDIAMALILADRRWGSGGSVNYNQLAVNEVNKVGSNDISSSDYHVYPGDLQGSDGSGDYPSYFTPAWYVEFGAVTGNGTFWGNVVTKCYTNLSAARDASGLATEQCSAAGAQIGSVDGYNSSRIPWRYSLDYVWNGTASSLAQITMDANFFAGKSGNGACCATYNTNGGNGTGTATCNDATYNGQRAGPAGTSMLVSAAHAADLTNFYSAASTFLGDSTHCYNATLALLSVLEESGNAPKMFGTPQATPTPLGGDIFDNCEDGDNVDLWGGYWYTYDDRDTVNKGNSYVVPWTQAYAATMGKTPPAFAMMAPGIAPGSMAYGARMTGNVTTTYTYGFVGMGAGTNFDSGSPDFAVTDVSMYTGMYIYIKSNSAVNKLDIKLKCAASVTNTASNDFKYAYTGTTYTAYVTLPFSVFTQATGWGITVSQALVLKNLTDVQFQTDTQPLANLDFEVDDIMFYPAKTPTPSPTFCAGQLVDNCEDGDNVNIFGGFWSSYMDPTGITTIWPSSVTYTPFVMSAPGANASLYCARMTGTVMGNTTTATFAGISTNMLPLTYTARNMSVFVGLTFWVKGDNHQYSVKLMPGTAVNDGQNDYKYTFTPPLSGGWQQMNISFSSFTQEHGWGTVVTLASVLQNLLSLHWESKGPGTLAGNHTYDLSIDDVEFECSQGWTPTATVTLTLPAGTNTFTPTVTATRTTAVGTNTDTPTMTPSYTNSPSPTATSTDTQVIPTATDTVTTVVPPTSTNTPVTGNTPVTQCLMLDNCDDGDNANMVPAGLGGPGYWYSYDDFYNAGTSYVVPWTSAECTKMGVANIPFYMQSPGCDGAGNDSAAGKAARITGYTTNADTDGGFVGMGMNLLGTPSSLTFTTCANYSPSPMDISGYTGLRFWVKGDGQSYLVKMPYTDPCTNNLDGYDDYQCLFPTVASTWTQIVIPFAAGPGLHFAQQGWGTAVNFNIVLQNARAIQFATQGNKGANLQIDLSVDNVELYVAGCGTTATNTPVIVPTSTNTPPPPTATNTPTTAPPTATSTIAVPTQTATTSTVPSMAISFNVPASVTVGQQLTVILTVNNNGTANLTNVVPGAISTSGTTAGLSFVSGPAPASDPSLTMTDTVLFTWIYTVTSPGTASFQDGANSDQATASIVTSSSVDCPAPTATNTPVIPTATFTITVTRTNTPVLPTATTTDTPNAAPTPTPSGVLQIPAPVFAFPNPDIIGTSGNPGPVVIDFVLTRPATNVDLRIYTTGLRLIRELSVNNAYVAGDNRLQVNGSYFTGLAQGAYYYIIIVTDSVTNQTAKSEIEKILLFR